MFICVGVFLKCGIREYINYYGGVSVERCSFLNKKLFLNSRKTIFFKDRSLFNKFILWQFIASSKLL